MLPPINFELTLEQQFQLAKIESQAAQASVQVLQESVVELSRQLMLARQTIADLVKHDIRRSLGIED